MEGVCYLTLSDRGFPKRLAFLYLEEIHAGFVEELERDHGMYWRDVVTTVARPYAFIKFGASTCSNSVVDSCSLMGLRCYDCRQVHPEEAQGVHGPQLVAEHVEAERRSRGRAQHHAQEHSGGAQPRRARREYVATERCGVLLVLDQRH
jgi:hypothetical protein